MFHEESLLFGHVRVITSLKHLMTSYKPLKNQNIRQFIIIGEAVNVSVITVLKAGLKEFRISWWDINQEIFEIRTKVTACTLHFQGRE